MALLAATLSGCTSMQSARMPCQDTVNVNHGAAMLVVAPPEARVCRGTTVTLRLLPRNRAASTMPKSGNPMWLTGSTPVGGDITLNVPANAPIGAIYDYEVNVTGVGMLDPTFVIIR